MKTIVNITVLCEPEKVGEVCYKMLTEGWQKDGNKTVLTISGKVRFEMWRNMEVNQ